jgi:hypothetical protein
MEFTIDVVSGSILFMATLIAIESYVRSHGKWYQFNIRDLMILNVVVALYLTVFMNADFIEAACRSYRFLHRMRLGFGAYGQNSYVVSRDPLPWFIVVPLQLATLCFLWDAGAVLLKAVECCHWLVSRILPRRGLTYQPGASAAASAAERRPGKEDDATNEAL